MHLPPLVLFGLLPGTMLVLGHYLLGGPFIHSGNGVLQAACQVIRMFSMGPLAVSRFLLLVRAS
jgi:hypothetical protein